MAFLNSEERKRVENCIRRAEVKTSGEIVVRVVQESHPYPSARWILASIGLGLATVIVLAIQGPGIAVFSFLEFQAIGFASGLLLSFVPMVRRWVLSGNAMAKAVHQASLATFLEAGVLETQQRTGILIYVSVFEHRVEILADKAIHAVCGSSYWQKHVHQLIEGIHQRKTAESLCHCIDQMGDQLAIHFPSEKNNPNELSDQIRET